jgi:hypothetical protein
MSTATAKFQMPHPAVILDGTSVRTVLVTIPAPAAAVADRAAEAAEDTAPGPVAPVDEAQEAAEAAGMLFA